MKRLRKKIFLAGMAVMALLVTAVTTTYAWFSLNDSAWVDGFELSITNSDHLLISYEDGPFKQALTNEDIVAAINSLRTEENQIERISDISLLPVTTLDGTNFSKLVSVFDEKNRQSIVYQDAQINSYVVMKLLFTVEANGTETPSTEHKSYELHFKTTGNSDTSIKATSFTSSKQTLNLVNNLTTFDENGSVTMEKGDELEVNPVNAIRVGVKGSNAEGSTNSSLNVIYDPATSDLGSYAFKEEVLDALKADALALDPNANINVYDDLNYRCNTNAMYTYFNSINNGCLYPIGHNADIEQGKAEVQGLLDLLSYDMSNTLGTFEYDEEEKAYNTVELNITIWLEGFDADNLIGINTTVIDCLLSFELKEKESE